MKNIGTKSVIMSDIMVYLDMFRVKKEVVKQVQGLRKGHLKHYCKFANLLASQREYMVAVYQYMLSLGIMEKGDYIFVCFDTEVLI